MLCERFRIKPNLLPFQRMAMGQNFCLVVGRDFLPFPDVVTFTGLIGLGTFFVMEAEKNTQRLG